MSRPSSLSLLLKLVRKDLIAGRYLHYTYLAIYLLLAPGLAFLMSEVFLFEYFPALWVIGLLGIENKSRTDSFVLSLPVRRIDVVAGRYLWALLTITLGCGMVFLVAYVVYAIDSSRFLEWLYIRNGWAVLYFFTPNLLPVLIAYPLSYRFGPVAGMVAGYAGVVAYLPIIITVERTLDRVHAGLGRILRVVDSQTGIFGYNSFLIGKTAEQIGPLLFAFCFIAALVILSGTSFGLSVLGYRRREI